MALFFTSIFGFSTISAVVNVHRLFLLIFFLPFFWNCETKTEPEVPLHTFHLYGPDDIRIGMTLAEIKKLYPSANEVDNNALHLKVNDHIHLYFERFDQTKTWHRPAPQLKAIFVDTLDTPAEDYYRPRLISRFRNISDSNTDYSRQPVCKLAESLQLPLYRVGTRAAVVGDPLLHSYKFFPPGRRDCKEMPLVVWLGEHGVRNEDEPRLGFISWTVRPEQCYDSRPTNHHASSMPIIDYHELLFEESAPAIGEFEKIDELRILTEDSAVFSLPDEMSTPIMQARKGTLLMVKNVSADSGVDRESGFVYAPEVGFIPSARTLPFSEATESSFSRLDIEIMQDLLSMEELCSRHSARDFPASSQMKLLSQVKSVENLVVLARVERDEKGNFTLHSPDSSGSGLPVTITNHPSAQLLGAEEQLIRLNFLFDTESEEGNICGVDACNIYDVCVFKPDVSVYDAQRPELVRPKEELIPNAAIH